MRIALLLTALTLAGLAAPASAQGTAFMPYLGYNFDSQNALIGVGTRFRLPITGPIAVTAQPAIEYQFEGTEGFTLLQGDFNAIAGFAGQSFEPYVGAGLAVVYVDTPFGSNTDLGFNLLGGALFNPTGFGQPFVQLRYTNAGGDALTLMGGVALSF